MHDDRDDETTFWRDQREQREQLRTVSDALRAEAAAVMCPDCHAAIDAVCVNEVTGLPVRGFPCHARRLTTARKANR